MKILITTDLFMPSVNGVVTSVLSLAHGLEKHGHEVRILTLSDTVHTHVDGNVIYLGSFSMGLLYPGIRIRKLSCHNTVRELIRWHPDVVHSQCEFSTFAIARTVARKCRIPLIHTYHTVYEEYTHYFSPSVRMGQAMAAQFSRHIANCTDAVIAPTKKVRRLLESYRVRSPIAVIPTGLEIKKDVNSTSHQSECLRQRLGIPAGTRVLLFLGRLAEEKNIPVLLRLLDYPELHDTVLVLVGDGPYRAELERRVKESGLSERVIFAGMVPHAQVVDYYHLGNVFVNASGSETQGLTYLEAMAAEIPVVCRADPCVEDLIANGKSGFACRNTAEMADAIEKLLIDPSLRESIIQTATALVAAAHTSDAFATAAENLYRTASVRCKRCADQTLTERSVSL